MKILRIAAVLVGLAALQGLACIEREVPPELVVTTVRLDEAVKANAQTRTIMFDAMAKNMKAQHNAQLKLLFDKTILELQLAQAKAGGAPDTVPVASMDALFVKIADKQKTFDADMATERIKWLNDPNLKIEAALSESLGLYLRSLDSFAREMASIGSLTGLGATEEGTAP